MAKPRGKNPTSRSSGRAEPAAAKGAGGDTGRVARPSAKDAAAKAVAKPPNKSDKSDKSDRAAKPPTRPKGKPAPTKRTTPSPTGRYTPPIPRSEKVSPIWVPIVMFGCLGLGMAIIILNYVNVLPGSDPSNIYLMVGLALITIGFITATKYH